MARPTLVSVALCLALCAATVQASEQLRGDFRNCVEVTPKCPVEATTYGYYPVLGPNAFLCALFALCCVGSLVLGFVTKTWTYTIALGIGTLLEAAGYGGRIMMHQNPFSESGFKLQIVCLVLAPSLVAACIYLTLKYFVMYCGPQYSPLKARLYPWVFIGCDIGSIVLQAVGGGIAASGGKTNMKLLDAGNNLIVTGIAFQVATMASCGVLVAVYVWRYRKQAPLRGAVNEKSTYQVSKERGEVSLGKIRIFAAAVGLAYVTVLIRCIYRLPEMSGGWGNPLMRQEQEFLILDGM
jgi:hypothetical protein